MPKELMKRVRAEEARNWLGIPEPFQLVDAVGVIFGSLVIWDAYNAIQKKKHYPLVPLVVGSVMLWIHSERFIYAPKTRQGLDNLIKSIRPNT